MHLFKSWIWAIESLKTLHYNSIIFASDDHDMIGAISKPAVLHDLLDWNVAVSFSSQYQRSKVYC